MANPNQESTVNVLATETDSLIETEYGTARLSKKNTQSASERSAEQIPDDTNRRLFQRSSISFPIQKRSYRHQKMVMEKSLSKKSNQLFERIETFFYILNQICIGFVTLYMSWLCLNLGLVKTALHAWLVTIGFSFLMAEGIMCHYNANVLTNNYSRTTKTTIHWILQAFGGSLGVAGILIKSIQKGFLLQSTHSKLGFSALILCVFSMLNGLFALYSTRFKHILSPLLNKFFHNLLGFVTFVIALLAQYYGYETGFFTRQAPTNGFRTMMQCITLISLVLSCIGPLKTISNKISNIYRQFK